MQVKRYNDNIFILDDGKVREFLIIDKDKALLIDTGFKNNDFILTVRSITDLPIELVITHADRDHIGNIGEFEKIYMHQNDFNLIEENIHPVYIKENDTINISNYHFQIIEIPGHTYGSIALLDLNSGLLLSGDSVQVGPIYMFGKHRNLEMYISSLQKLMTYKKDIKVILPSHHDYPLTADYIDYCLNDAMSLKNGQLKGKEVLNMDCLCYQGKYVQFLY